ncbi:MAG TPA: flagellar basal body P-ring protein FlgI [Phycisphaerales bacterium]|nr:flagellar basal body P-ring protein FlgI [Phycisphaerales bacterium]
MSRSRIIVALCSAAFALLALVSSAHALGVKEMARLSGQGETTIWGIGFVTGLAGTGDSGDTQPLARQLAALLEKGGNSVPDLKELTKAKNIALVMVQCKIPREGARRGDNFDVSVTAYHNASSLKGGRLFITPLQGPLPNQGVFAYAEGPIIFDEASLTSGRVRGGANISHDIAMNVVTDDGKITLIIAPGYASWSTSRLIAGAVNADREGLESQVEEIARAVDDRTVAIRIPDAERANPANFIAAVMEIQLDPSLLSLPARVIINEKKGDIVVTGDVQISPVVIAHKDMVITTLNPPRPPTPESPILEESRWTSLTTLGGDRNTTQLRDLLEALKRLDIPVPDQIEILTKIHRIGRLHAELITE